MKTNTLLNTRSDYFEIMQTLLTVKFSEVLSPALVCIAMMPSCINEKLRHIEEELEKAMIAHPKLLSPKKDGCSGNELPSSTAETPVQPDNTNEEASKKEWITRLGDLIRQSAYAPLLQIILQLYTSEGRAYELHVKEVTDALREVGIAFKAKVDDSIVLAIQHQKQTLNWRYTPIEPCTQFSPFGDLSNVVNQVYETWARQKGPAAVNTANVEAKAQFEQIGIVDKLPPQDALNQLVAIQTKLSWRNVTVNITPSRMLACMTNQVKAEVLAQLIVSDDNRGAVTDMESTDWNEVQRVLPMASSVHDRQKEILRAQTTALTEVRARRADVYRNDGGSAKKKQRVSNKFEEQDSQVKHCEICAQLMPEGSNTSHAGGTDKCDFHPENKMNDYRMRYFPARIKRIRSRHPELNDLEAVKKKAAEIVNRVAPFE